MKEHKIEKGKEENLWKVPIEELKERGEKGEDVCEFVRAYRLENSCILKSSLIFAS